MTPYHKYTTHVVTIFNPFHLRRQRTSYLLLRGLYGGVSNEFSVLVSARGANFVFRVDFRVVSIGGLRCNTGVEGQFSGTFVPLTRSTNTLCVGVPTIGDPQSEVAIPPPSSKRGL